MVPEHLCDTQFLDDFLEAHCKCEPAKSKYWCHVMHNKVTLNQHQLALNALRSGICMVLKHIPTEISVFLFSKAQIIQDQCAVGLISEWRKIIDHKKGNANNADIPKYHYLTALFYTHSGRSQTPFRRESWGK